MDAGYILPRGHRVYDLYTCPIHRRPIHSLVVCKNLSVLTRGVPCCDDTVWRPADALLGLAHAALPPPPTMALTLTARKTVTDVSLRLLLPLKCQTPRKAPEPPNPTKTPRGLCVPKCARIPLLVPAPPSGALTVRKSRAAIVKHFHDDAIKTMTTRSEALVKKYIEPPLHIPVRPVSAKEVGQRMSTHESKARDAHQKRSVEKCMEWCKSKGRATWNEEIDLVDRLFTKSVDHEKATMEKLWKRYEAV